jgi:hypothetical protein
MWAYQKNGGRGFEERTWPELSGTAFPVGVAVGNTIEAIIEWGGKGHTRGLTSFTFDSRPSGGHYTLKVTPYDSNGVKMGGDVDWPLIPDLQDVAGGGPTVVFVNFFDGPVAGNWNTFDTASGDFDQGGNVPNPTVFTNAAMLRIRLVNVDGSEDLNVTAWNFLLSGDN